MLHVPELKPGEQPFDPDFFQAMTPWKTAGEENSATAAIPVGSSPWMAGTEAPRERTPEEQIQVLLNLAVVKEAVTQFHREEDAHLRRLESYASAKICELVADHETFLRDAVAAGENACGNEERKALFRTMTAAFIAQSRERAQRLQGVLAERYWKQSVEEQNAELLARALREENIADDRALTLHRDLIFYNLENMLFALPEGEKRRAMDAAGTAFYEKVLEKRLERDPRGALAMAGEREVRRVLGEAACAALEERAKKALREEELERIADDWVRKALPPAEAEEKARARFGKDEERAHVLRRYHAGRFAENRRLVGATIAQCASVWAGLKEQEFDENALPAWVVRNNPALASCMRECVRARADAGGGEGRVDYGALMAFAQQLEKKGARGAMESLREEEACHSLLIAAGGPEGKEWARCVRVLGGVADDRDREWGAALRLAWGGEGRSQAFMERFVDALHREEEKGALCARELVRRIEESFLDIME